MVIPQENRAEPWAVYAWIDALRGCSSHIQRQRQWLMELRGEISKRLKVNHEQQQYLVDHAQLAQVFAADKTLRTMEDMCLSITGVLNEMDRAMIGIEVSLPANPDMDEVPL